MQRKYDILLQAVETPEGLRDIVERQCGVVAAVAPGRFNRMHTLIVEGTIKQLMAVNQWYSER